MSVKIEGLNYGLKPSRDYVNWREIAANGSVGSLAVLAVDQAKFNLAYLVFPEIEQASLSAVPSEFVDNVGDLMDKETRHELYRPPLTFMKYWAALHKKLTPVPLSVVMPDDYMSRMYCQAHRIQSRLVEKDGNVMRVVFGG